MSSDLALHRVCGDESALIDVLFLHGLTGDPFSTWTSPECHDKTNAFWPAWLCQDLAGMRCHTVGYPASIFEQWAKKEMDLFERAKSILDLLDSHSFGSRPMVLVCHSLGGLLAKHLLKTAELSGSTSWKAITNAVSLVVFLATPHTGSGLATVLKLVAPRLASVHIEALRGENSQLNELNEFYRAAAKQRPIKTVVYYEKFKMKGSVLVVTPASADPGVADTVPIPVDADHESICKPSSKNSVVYLGVKKNLQAVMPRPLDEPTSREARAITDRRDLLQKLIDANREHEYTKANEMQSRFAREYYRLGLHTPAKQQIDALLSEVEQRFILHVYHAKICHHATDEEIMEAVQSKVIDPVAAKRTASGYGDPLQVMQALYYLTEQCFISWNPV
jgi:protein SERAC1